MMYTIPRFNKLIDLANIRPLLYYADITGGFQIGNDERENTLNQLLVEMDGLQCHFFRLLFL